MDRFFNQKRFTHQSNAGHRSLPKDFTPKTQKYLNILSAYRDIPNAYTDILDHI
jgi:hypothetical protein